jgi:tetratricopeptide (TPR) repeat protein
MKIIRVVGFIAALAVGVVAGIAATAAKSVPALYSGKSPKEAANALLAVAEGQAGKGSWENIAVARGYLLMGDVAMGRKILDRVSAEKMKGNDWIRVGRLWNEAGEWDKAKEAFEKALALEPNDAEYLAEVGAWYNLHGDRVRAEELFARSLAKKNDEVWNTLNIAGSYVGIKPQ